MPIDISWHVVGATIEGQAAPAPRRRTGGQKGLAEATNSGAITIAATSVLRMKPTVKVRVDVQATTGALDPANSPFVLSAEETGFLTLDPGTWYLKTAVYS